MRKIQERVMHIIDVAYAMKHNILGKHVLFDNVYITIQLFVKIYMIFFKAY
jgi:hypothetical protein